MFHLVRLRQHGAEQAGEAVGVRAEEHRVRRAGRIGAVDEEVVSQRRHPDAGLVAQRMRLEAARLQALEHIGGQDVGRERKAPAQGAADVPGHPVLGMFQDQPVGRRRRGDEPVAALAQQLQQPHSRCMVDHDGFVRGGVAGWRRQGGHPSAMPAGRESSSPTLKGS